MKFIKLECATLGHAYGDVIPVGGKGNLSLEDAKVLVADKMAKPYNEPVANGGDCKALQTKVTELEEANTTLQTKVTELEEANTTLQTKVTELEQIIAAVNTTVDAKTAGTK